MPIESQIAAFLLWVVALGWALPAPWLMWWVIARGRLPVLPLIGEPNGGPFYRRLSRASFVVLLGLSLALGAAQAWAGWLLWEGQQLGAVVQFGLLPIEVVFWYGFALPIPPMLALMRIVLVVLAWPRLG
jgi:hypothetical protein